MEVTNYILVLSTSNTRTYAWFCNITYPLQFFVAFETFPRLCGFVGEPRQQLLVIMLLVEILKTIACNNYVILQTENTFYLLSVQFTPKYYRNWLRVFVFYVFVAYELFPLRMQIWVRWVQLKQTFFL